MHSQTLTRIPQLLAVTLALVFAAAPLARANDSGCPAPGVSDGKYRPVPEVVSGELHDSLMGWIALNTSYDVKQAYTQPPTLSFCGIGDFIAYEGTDLLIEEPILAAFDYSQRHIFLVKPWSPENLVDQSILLHELIHDVQLLNKDWDCIGAPELEAYFLQDKWLSQKGVRLPFNWPLIIQLSRCPDRDADSRH